jgi:hypothetical protein
LGIPKNPRIQIASNGRPMSAQVSVSNSEMINMILEFYTKPHDIIADVTYGFGNFWKKQLPDRWFLFSDIEPIDERIRKMDYNHLEYHNSTINCLVFDPPYAKQNFSFDYRHKGSNESDKVTYSEDNSYWNADHGLPEQEFVRVLKQNGLIIHKHSNMEPPLSLFKQIDIFFSVTPFNQASLPIHKSRPNYSVWHVLRKIDI